MRTPRLAGLGLVSMAAVAFAVTGCTADSDATPGAGATASDSPSASASGPADPAAAAALGQAAAALGTSSFKLTMTAGSGLKLNGLIDAPNGKGTADLVATGTNTEITVKSLLVGQDLYVQVPGVTKANTWTHLDVSRLPEGANVGLRPGQIDPSNTAQLLTATTDVQQVDARSFKGTLDMTKAADVAGVSQALIKTYGAQAQDVPFTAGLDDQGRLSALTIQLPAINGQQAQPLEVLYTDYGTAVDAQKPAAAQITEAPNDFYTTLGG